VSSPALECADLEVRPGVRPLNLRVSPGEVYGLLGPEGAGKTAILRSLAGLWRSRSGACRVLGLSPAEKGLAVRRRLGYVAERGGLPAWMNAREAEELVGGLQPSWDSSLFGRLLDLLEVPDDRPAGVLAVDEAAALGLALALGHRPHALLLDEPFGDLEPERRARLLKPVLDGARESGMAVLLAARRPARLEDLVDRVGILLDGMLVEECTIAEIMDRFRRVRLGFVGEPPEEIRLEGVLRVELDQEGLILVVEGYGEDLQYRLAALRPARLEALPLSLEEAVGEVARAATQEETDS